jgi:hypothetical protein
MVLFQETDRANGERLNAAGGDAANQHGRSKGAPARGSGGKGRAGEQTRITLSGSGPGDLTSLEG